MGDWVALAVLAAAFLAVLGISLWRHGPAASLPGAAEQFASAAKSAVDLVTAAEQLWLTGELTRDGRLVYVMGLLREFYPDLDEHQLRATVEAAVYWLKQMQGGLPVQEDEFEPEPEPDALLGF